MKKITVQKPAIRKNSQQATKGVLENVKKYREIKNKFLFKNRQIPNKFRSNLIPTQNQRSRNRSGI